MTDVIFENSIPKIPVTSEEVTGQKSAIIYPLPDQSEILCKLTQELRQETSRRDEKTSNSFRG